MKTKAGIDQASKSFVFLSKAVKKAGESGCLRAKTAAVLVKDGKVILSACNLVLPRADFCQASGCLRDKLKLGLGKEAEKCRSIHAEARAVCLAAQRGRTLDGAIAFVTCQPCINCAKILYSAGIKKVFFLDRHADQTGQAFLERMGVKCQWVKLPSDDQKQRLRDVKGQQAKLNKKNF